MSILETMTTIRPAAEFGSVLTGRTQAKALRRRVESLVHEGTRVVLDFEGVVAVSPSFADELFAKLDANSIEDGEVTFANVDPSLAAIARFVREGRPTAHQR